MRVCSNCGKVYNDGSKFCVSCGGEIIEKESINNAAQNDQGVNNYQNTMNQGQQFNAPSGSMYQGSNQTSNTDKTQLIYQWGPVAAAVLGVLLAWTVSMWFGLLVSLGALAVSFVMRQKVSKPIISIVASGIAVVICIAWMILYV